MKLRSQLLTLALAVLLVPWFGWKLVQELELFLRAGQESALLAAAGTVAQALPAEFQAELRFGRERILPLREFEAAPIVDGYADDWPEPGSALTFTSADGELRLDLLAGRHRDRLYLLGRVHDLTPVRDAPPLAGPDPRSGGSDGILLYLRSARGLAHFSIHTAAPGPLVVSSQPEGGGQLEGHWLDLPDGYRVELALPPAARHVDLSLGAVDAGRDRLGRETRREAGTLADGRPASWLAPAPPSPELAAWLARVAPADTRAWVVDRRGWVMAATGSAARGGQRELTWAERLLYRLVAGRRTELRGGRIEGELRLADPVVDAGLAGATGQHWSQDRENAVVRNTVAVPVTIDGEVRGAVVMEASMDGLLLATNRALGRLLLSTLLITAVLVAGMWFFATRLSRRVQHLSGAVSRAMDDAAHPRDLPLTRDRDELGELARNNARLLRAVSDYTAYLRKLAGRLGHELKTPLAITRSSLDNLASRPLDPESARYLERAREGLDRQAAIVRAMSEASRLEAAIQAAEWQDHDLAGVLRQAAAAYRALYPQRRIELDCPAGPCRARCAPDLIVQALDKLVDNAAGLSGADDTITLVLEPRAPGWALEVRNTGTRLPDTLTEQLFDSLVSVREVREGGPHLGLGLYIVRLVAEAHGGTASARNLPGGEGVAFRFTGVG